MKRRWRGRGGFSLVEVIAAVLILALVTVAVMTGVGFSRQTVAGTGSREAAAAQARETADQLISALSVKNPPSEAELEQQTGAFYQAGDFSYGKGREKQFRYEAHAMDGVEGYRITVAVFYMSGKQNVTVTAFAAADSEEFSGEKETFGE